MTQAVNLDAINAFAVTYCWMVHRFGNNALGCIVGKPSKWSVKLPRNRLRGHVPQQYLPNSVMDQKPTSGQLPEATSTGRALYVKWIIPICISRKLRDSI